MEKIEKKEFVEKMEKVKIIVGNGFDLHCGLMSSYNNYFNYYKKKYDRIKDWINKSTDNIPKNSIESDFLKHWVDFEGMESINLWDVFFEMINMCQSDEKKRGWCDIEKLMSLSFSKDSDASVKIPKWNNVYRLVSQATIPYGKWSFEIVLASFYIKKFSISSIDNELTFYLLLLDELKSFEKNFGKYLARQHDFFDRFINHHNSEYDDKALRTLSLFGSAGEKGNIVSIDSFNYGCFNSAEYDCILRNINGTLQAPIFGVDSKSLGEGRVAEFVFSKTNRRMEMDMSKAHTFVDSGFENAVVYGHSLSESDYSYFFPLMDQLNMTNFSSKNKMVFAFSIFNQNQAFLIEFNYRLAIQLLFENYALFKGYSEKDAHRLLDALTAEGRIVLYEVPCFNGQPNYFWD